MNILEIAEYLRSINLKDKLTYYLTAYQNLLRHPATGIELESLTHRSLEDLNVICEYNSGSHSQEKDMVFEINGERLFVSLKGCKETKNRFGFSSYRTTKAETKEEKLDLIEKLDANLDLMMIFARYHVKNNIFPEYYKVYLMDPDFINPKKFKWKTEYYEDGTIKTYRTEKNSLDVNVGLEFDVEMEIRKKLSSQLWVSASKSVLLKYPNEIIELMEIRI